MGDGQVRKTNCGVINVDLWCNQCWSVRRDDSWCNLDFGFQILDFGFQILDFGFQILDFGSASDQVLVVRRWTH